MQRNMVLFIPTSSPAPTPGPLSVFWQPTQPSWCCPLSTRVRGCPLQNGNLLAFENLNFYKPCHSLLQIYQFVLVFGFQLLKWNDSVKTAWTSSDAGYCVYEVLVSDFSYYLLAKHGIYFILLWKLHVQIV